MASGESLLAYFVLTSRNRNECQPLATIVYLRPSNSCSCFHNAHPVFSLHPTSLPSRGGIGDFGPAAYEFVDWLAAAKQTLWQVLPLGPVGYGNSPYSCTSAFAANVLMISLERLADRGLIDRERIGPPSDGDSPVDFEQRAPAQASPLAGGGQKLLAVGAGRGA